MKYVFLSVILFLLIAFCGIAKKPSPGENGKQAPVKQSLPRIAIAGIAIESSTFSPARTDEAAFQNVCMSKEKQA